MSNNVINKERKRKKRKDYRVELLIRIALTIVIALLLFNFVFGIFIVSGNYMFPSIRDGDLLMTYRLDPAQAEEVIVYKAEGKTRIGRVVAIAGDTVEITEAGELLINGQHAAEEVFYPTFSHTGSNIEYPYVVPDNELFVMNDYRTLEKEKDSRDYGGIPIKDCRGTVSFAFRRRGF